MDSITFKEIREKNKLSLAEMSDVLGLSKKLVFRMEKGDKMISDEVESRIDIIFTRKNKEPENSVKWHPYPTYRPRLKNGYRLLVTKQDGRTEIMNYNHFCGNEAWNDVAAWAELPEPFKEEKKTE